MKGIEKYFEALYHFRGESLDKKKVLEEFVKKNYNFAKVGQEFRLIEENTLTVFISNEEEAEKLLQEIKISGIYEVRYAKSGTVLCTVI